MQEVTEKGLGVPLKHRKKMALTPWPVECLGVTPMFCVASLESKRQLTKTDREKEATRRENSCKN